MKRFRITYTNNTTNEAVGDSDIWTGTDGVSSVEDIGFFFEPTPSKTVTGKQTYLATVRAKANSLIKKGKTLEALVLLKTIGE